MKSITFEWKCRLCICEKCHIMMANPFKGFIKVKNYHPFVLVLLLPNYPENIGRNRNFQKNDSQIGSRYLFGCIFVSFFRGHPILD